MTEDIKTQLSTLTGARQTMASWSKIIESYEAVPNIYKSYLKSYTGEGKIFPYTILSPALEKFLLKTTEKLVFERDDAIHILERAGNRIVEKSYPYKNVSLLEVGNILLSSWMVVSGITSEGVHSSSTIDFNAATGERLFSVFLKKMRPASLDADESAFAAEKNKFDALADSNFKFMNYGRASLVYGEKVLQIILQPKIREPLWKFAGWTIHRTVSLAHLTILTDKELILIRDDERGEEIKGVKYGGVWQYIPLKSIRSITLVDAPNSRLSLTITLSSGDTIKKVFNVSRQPELEQFRDKIKGVTV